MSSTMSSVIIIILPHHIFVPIIEFICFWTYEQGLWNLMESLVGTSYVLQKKLANFEI